MEHSSALAKHPSVTKHALVLFWDYFICNTTSFNVQFYLQALLSFFLIQGYSIVTGLWLSSLQSWGCLLCLYSVITFCSLLYCLLLRPNSHSSVNQSYASMVKAIVTGDSSQQWCSWTRRAIDVRKSSLSKRISMFSRNSLFNVLLGCELDNFIV